MKERGDYVDSVRRARSGQLARICTQAIDLYPSQVRDLGQLGRLAVNNGLGDDAVFAQVMAEMQAGIERARQAHEAAMAASASSSSSSSGSSEGHRHRTPREWLGQKLGRKR